MKHDCTCHHPAFSVVVTTPGRFANLLEKVDGLKNWLKALEVLIIDEADRFVDVEFRNRYFVLTASRQKVWF